MVKHSPNILACEEKKKKAAPPVCESARKRLHTQPFYPATGKPRRFSCKMLINSNKEKIARFSETCFQKLSEKRYKRGATSLDREGRVRGGGRKEGRSVFVFNSFPFRSIKTTPAFRRAHKTHRFKSNHFLHSHTPATASFKFSCSCIAHVLIACHVVAI